MCASLALVVCLFAFADKDIDDLIAKTKSKKTTERIAAFKELAKKGEAAKEATEVVCNAFASEGKSDVGLAAADCLEAIQPKIGPLVTTMMVDGSLAAQGDAAVKLAALGAEAKGTAAIFRKHLDRLGGVDEVLRTEWVQADLDGLATTAPDDPTAIEATSKHVPRWREIFGSTFAAGVVQRVFRFGTGNEKQMEKALKVGFPFLSDPDIEVRLAAIEGFGAAGKAAKPALPALQKLKFDKSEAVRKAVRKAIEMIDAE